MVETQTASPIARKYLRLHLCNGIGAIRFANLLHELGDIDRVLGASVAELASVKQVGPKSAETVARDRDGVEVDREIELAQRRNIRILCLADADYPIPLRMINDPPPCIYVRGTLERTDALALAIVGARHSSRYGAEQAERFGALVANAGLTVVSGMARGIDAAAHRGALIAGGRTLAVLGCGLCHLYPPDSIELADEIADHGAVMSELPMEIAPDPKHFPPRNRVIVGLALGVLVVEAARRSGALISARLGNEYNREVFAVPGRIDTPHAEGCNALIQTGSAKLVTKLEDILEELGEAGAALMPDKEEKKPGASATSGTLANLNQTETQVLKALGAEPMPVEAVCEASNLPAAQVASALTGLQLKGVVRRVQGDLFERTDG